VRRAIEAAGATVRYLPPYSPDLNPIEMAFSKLKALLRKAALRTVDGLWAFLGEALYAFAPDECRDSFRHCGSAAQGSEKRTKPLGTATTWVIDQFRLFRRGRPAVMSTVTFRPRDRPPRGVLDVGVVVHSNPDVGVSHQLL
jgi:hypothetical protein